MQPSGTAISAEIRTAKTPTSIEALPPSRTRMSSSRPSGPSAPRTISVVGALFGGGSKLPYSSSRTCSVVGTCDHTPTGSRLASAAYGNCWKPLWPTIALTIGPPANDAKITTPNTKRDATAARSERNRPSVSLHAARGAARGASTSTAVTAVTIDGTSGSHPAPVLTRKGHRGGAATGRKTPNAVAPPLHAFTPPLHHAR